MSQKKKLDVEIQLKILLKKSSTDERKRNDDEKIMINLSGGPNRSIPSLSKYVKINYSESMGRCLIVTNNLNPGKETEKNPNRFDYPTSVYYFKI